jgi:hypothetical protein
VLYGRRRKISVDFVMIPLGERGDVIRFIHARLDDEVQEGRPRFIWAIRKSAKHFLGRSLLLVGYGCFFVVVSSLGWDGFWSVALVFFLGAGVFMAMAWNYRRHQMHLAAYRQFAARQAPH